MIVEIFSDIDSSIGELILENPSLKDLKDLVGGNIKIYKLENFVVIVKKRNAKKGISNRMIRKRYLKQLTEAGLLLKLSKVVLVIKNYF
ncbi:MAG TPA: hypothetical protein ENH06_00040 [bacterium]|nr:hypothetical protein [bacterium]